MSTPIMLAHLVLERFSQRALPRVPESDLIMGTIAQNAAFERVGREDGLLAYLYLYNTMQISPLIKPGDRVLDLGCGPANQLSQIAKMNPQAHFTGLDASPEMLHRAQTTVRRSGIVNIDLIEGDMTQLAGFADSSFDCVISTMSLHHLPDMNALVQTMNATRRVLKQGGALYMIDFGRLKHVSTMRFFAEDRIDLQPEEFTCDFFNSLRAAFSLSELSQAMSQFGDNVQRYTTAMVPFMVIFKSAGCRELDEETKQSARELYRSLSASQQKDFRRYALWLKIGGLDLPFFPG